ncbi:beta-phosphoglucomutase [Fournierella sp.]|uniref:beta-phosphoglucomutase n=1 Tax=Allofournierella sp. TaxID=1940256 RepID=UPI0025B8C339|nr:beta-phosphoglucomutase [Fournierella sp.]
MEKNNLKAVVFDLDGVLTDSAKYHYQAWKMLADKLGIPFDEEYNEKLKGVSRMESLELILQNGNAQDKYTQEEKVAMATEKNEFYKQLIHQITPEDVLPGIHDFLEQLKAAGIKTAVASVSHNAPFILERLELDKYFDYICDAAQVPRAKPFPDIFLSAAQNLGVEPANCIGVEDAQAGIQAINAAGMMSVGVGTESQMQEAKLILPSTAKLGLGMLKEYFQLA